MLLNFANSEWIPNAAKFEVQEDAVDEVVKDNDVEGGVVEKVVNDGVLGNNAVANDPRTVIVLFGSGVVEVGIEAFEPEPELEDEVLVKVCVVKLLVPLVVRSVDGDVVLWMLT